MGIEISTGFMPGYLIAFLAVTALTVMAIGSASSTQTRFYSIAKIALALTILALVGLLSMGFGANKTMSELKEHYGLLSVTDNEGVTPALTTTEAKISVSVVTKDAKSWSNAIIEIKDGRAILFVFESPSADHRVEAPVKQ